jgi:hypothetical protein
MLPRRKKLLILLSTVGIGACFFLPAEIGSLGHTFAQTTSETKIVPLDLKPGLWEFHIHTSNTDVSYAAGKASMVEMTKNYTPEQRAKAMADYETRENKAIADREKGRTENPTIVP